ncbi:MAG: type IV pilus assembly protein PilM [Thermoanaerobacterales bacterium]|nr:type IV pilus assembly protein PilM [Thermoanaerobacterales bacterium]
MAFLKPAGVVGLELDAGEVRAVELRGGARAPVLAAWGREPLPDGAVVEGAVVRAEPVAAALERLWSAAGIAGREVVLGLANQGVIIRFATMPKVPANRLAQAVRYQAEDYLPLPLSQVVLDYAVLGEAAGENGPVLEILLVAARRDMLDAFLRVLDAARLKPRAVDAAPLALARLLPPAEREGVTVLVDVGNGLSHLLLAAGGVPRFARLIPVSLQDAARMFGRSLETIVPPQAGAEPEGGEEDWYPDTLRAWSESLAGEIRSSIGYYLAQPGSAPVARVVLSGRGARFPGLAARLQEILGLPVTRARPLDGIAVPRPRGGGDIAREAPDFAVCVGLARRGWEA